MSEQTTNSIIIKFSEVSVQPPFLVATEEGLPIVRATGFVQAKNLFPLFDNAGLTANPRSSRRNSVVEDILNTIATTPELFRYKSKGLLIGTANYQELQRQRYRLTFNDPEIEGILDGGHNMLAIGLYALQFVMEEVQWKKIKSWDAMKVAWDDNRKKIEKFSHELNFAVPVEILIPSGHSVDDVDAFLMPLLEVCEARNNNAQLPIEAKSNKQGFYDSIKDNVTDEFAARVEWKPNSWEDDEEKRPIKVRDLVALSWIPLNALNEAGMLPIDISVSAQNTYRNKGECSKKFEELMSNSEVTEQLKGARRKLKNASVHSAFKILADLPALYDQIYRSFPAAYNGNGSGKRRFGANPIVKLYDPESRKAAKDAGKDVTGYVITQPKTPYYREDVNYNYPDGLIVPLFYGLKGLMKIENGSVVWSVEDPSKFLKENLTRIADSYHLVMNMAGWDPQKIAKNPDSYEFAVREFRNAFLDQNSRRKSV